MTPSSLGAHLKRLLWPALLAGATAATTSGCEIVLLVAATTSDDGDDCYDACSCYGDCFTDDGVAAPPVPPTFEIEIADWPPVGPEGEVIVDATAQDGLASATFTFREVVTKNFSGAATQGTVSAFGDELGEGLGTLDVVVRTTRNATARREVASLLVDLSPPTAYTDDSILPAQGAELAFWIADAWVVSGYELTVGSATFTDQLEPGYPSTLGVDWDYSLVTIPVEQIAVGVHLGSLRVWDAAGNEALVDFPVTIDGIPPTASLDAPGEGTTVSGPFSVTMSGQDDLPGTVALELTAGGALVATGLGPSATVVLDALELPEGPIVVSAIATDAAGNESAPSSRTLIVSHTP